MISPETGGPFLTRREFVIGSLCTGAAGLAVADEKVVAQKFLPGTNWPMYRRDPALTAESPIKGGLADEPVVAWTLDLGGPHVAQESIVVRDVTGDGLDEFSTLRADAVVCRDNRGVVLWQLDDFLNPTIVDILDFAGDGSRGILATTTRAGKIDTYMINGRTGRATHLWLDENNFGGHTRIGPLLPGVAGVQIAATASGQTPPAPQGGRPVWHHGMTRDTAGRWGQFVDLDGDGRREVVHVQPDGVLRCFAPGPPVRCPNCPADSPLAAGQGHDERWQFDAGRPISRVIAADLDGDGRKELLFGGDDGKLHALGERDGKPQLLWSLSLGRRVGEPILADIDGDGQPEILVAVEDGKLYCLKGS